MSMLRLRVGKIAGTPLNEGKKKFAQMQVGIEELETFACTEALSCNNVVSSLQNLKLCTLVHAKQSSTGGLSEPWVSQCEV